MKPLEPLAQAELLRSCLALCPGRWWTWMEEKEQLPQGSVDAWASETDYVSCPSSLEIFVEVMGILFFASLGSLTELGLCLFYLHLSLEKQASPV